MLWCMVGPPGVDQLVKKGWLDGVAPDAGRCSTESGAEGLARSSRWCPPRPMRARSVWPVSRAVQLLKPVQARGPGRSEEHTSELQSHLNLVCRLLLEKKKKNIRVKAAHGR